MTPTRNVPAPAAPAEPEPRLPASAGEGSGTWTAPPEPLDPAQQAMADALRVTFLLLKIVMLALVVAFLLSGCYTVESQKAAVRLLFGRVVGDGPARIVQPGGPYFAAPYPIMRVVKIPTSSRTLRLDRSFWYQSSDSYGQTRAELGSRGGPLNPLKDGSLLTGDANVVHSQWTIIYRVQDPVLFLEHVGDPSSETQMMSDAESLVRDVAERSVVHAVAQFTADQIQKGLRGADYEAIRRSLQAALDNLESGLRVESVTATQVVFPLPVQESFRQVLQAQNEKARRIDEAQKERSTILGETAGEAYEPLLALIQQYELASSRQDTTALRQLDQQLDAAFRNLSVPWDDRQVPIGGKVASRMNDASVYRGSVVKRTQADAEYFRALKTQYDHNARVVLDRLWQDAIQQALADPDVEMLFVPRNWEPDLRINRSPEKQRQREERRIQAQQNR